MLIALSILFSGGCLKDQFTTSSSAKLRFSVDTLTFDTVFTTIGSVTLSMKVFNDNKSKIKISSVTLGGGANSPFKINVDGVQGPAVQSVEINGHDSIYIFVQVTVNPNNKNNPIVIYDSLQFLTNGNHQQVILDAWGQDAHFFNSQAISGSTTWTNDKPYVILNSLLVSPGTILTINSGVTVYMGGNSGLIIAGGLKVNGNSDSKCDSVVFRGLRTESYYANVPGQWSGIYILRNATCTIDRAIIENSYYGLNIGSATSSQLSSLQQPLPGTNVDSVTNTIIENTESTAIYCFAWNAVFKIALLIMQAVIWLLSL